jgi:alkylation response protein AidB-like acyl-CoA dehydrogenase
MDFAKSDIQLMLLDSAERLLGEKAGVEYWREQRHGLLGFDVERWAQFAELGWFALPLPEEAGGLAGSIEDIALLNIELGRALATEPYVSTAVLGAHLIARGAAEDQAADLLGRIAAGSLRLALAHREPAHDALALTSVATCARRQGDGFVLSGTKTLALDAPSADMLIVSAAMDGEDGTALFLVDAESPGVTLDTYPMVDGTRAADILFTDVALSAESLIAGGNAGAALLGEALDRATIALFAQAVGSMEACLRICGDYTNERKQFGTAIGAFQAIQHILADMFVAANQARSMLYHAISSAHGDAAQRAAALSAAAIVIGEAGQLVARNGIQVHGGYGLTDEYAISHHYRRLMGIEKLHGDIARHTRRLGDQLFAA